MAEVVGAIEVSHAFRYLLLFFIINYYQDAAEVEEITSNVHKISVHSFYILSSFICTVFVNK